MILHDLGQQEHSEMLQVQLGVNQIVDGLLAAADLAENLKAMQDYGVAVNMLRDYLNDLQKVHALIHQKLLNYQFLAKGNGEACENRSDRLAL